MTAAQQLRVSPEVYLQQEAEADARSEYLDGVVVAMAGGSIRHNLVCARLIQALGNALAGGPCRVFTSDQRVRLEATNRYAYPDVSVVCGPLEVDPRSPETLTNPKLLIEVLSPSTAAQDRGDKFAAYRLLPSLTTYLLVDPDGRRVERFERGPHGWVLTDHADGAVPLPAVGASLALGELFADLGQATSAKPT